MADIAIKSKRVKLDRAQVIIVSTIAVACFVTIFSLTAAKSIYSTLTYQNRVIAQKETAKKNLVASATARDQLVKQYQSFVGTSSNIIGGSSSGTADNDGDNATIVLDALPSKYDYPALASSLEKLLTGNGVTISSIAGSDDEVNQSSSPSADAKPVAMPFTLGFTGNYQATQNILSILQRSIRPIQIQHITFSGNDADLTTSITAETDYQPGKTFTIKKQVVK